jgi:DNA-binding transcriptional LysR family regulator
MDFREFEYVVSIAKHQRVGKAAEECCITQPAMSKFIQTLEYNLGQPLFHRLGNKFLLTYAGERYVETAKIILETEKRLKKELSDIVREDIGEMKIAFRLCGGINAMPELLSVFWKQYPRVKIKIHEDTSGVIENELLNGDIDLAFITLPFKHPDVSTQLISQEELLLIMSGNHPMADKAVVKDGCKYPWMDINILKDESFILPWPAQRTRQMADRIFRDEGIKPNVLLTVKNTNAMIELASKGFGIAFVGEATLWTVPEKENLRCFSVGSPNTEFSLAIALRSAMYQPTYIKHFIDIAKSLWDFGRDRQAPPAVIH